MNFLTGFVLLALLLAQNTFFVVPVIDTLMEGFPYENAQGLLPGDRIVRVNGERDLSPRVTWICSLAVTRTASWIWSLSGTAYAWTGRALPSPAPGIHLRGRDSCRCGGLSAVREPFHVGSWLRQSWYNTIDMVRMVRLSLVDLFSGRAGIQDMSGPIGIVTMMSDVGAQSPNMGGRTGEYPVVRGLHRHQPGGDEPAAHPRPGWRAAFSSWRSTDCSLCLPGGSWTPNTRAM